MTKPLEYAVDLLESTGQSRTIEERQGVGQESLTVFCQRGTGARSAVLVVQLRPHSTLQGEQPVSHPLLGDVERGCGGPQRAVTGEFDQGGHLIGGE